MKKHYIIISDEDHNFRALSSEKEAVDLATTAVETEPYKRYMLYKAIGIVESEPNAVFNEVEKGE